MKISTFFALTALALIAASQLYAQKRETLDLWRRENGTVKYAKIASDQNISVSNAVATLKKILQAKDADNWVMIRETTDSRNEKHRVYQQYYKNVLVEQAQYRVHARNNKLTEMNGHYELVELQTTVPATTVSQALTAALDYVKAEKYKWQDPNLERFLKDRTGDTAATYYPKGSLVITKVNEIRKDQHYRLAWKFPISTLVPNNELWVYVDAIKGNVIASGSRLLDGNVSCSANTSYSGPLAITGDSFSGGYRLQESRNGVTIKTLNANNTTNLLLATDFVNTTTSFTSSGWANFAQDRAALDAHWASETVLDYWNTVHGRNSLDGSGLSVFAFCHYDTNLGNAFWDPGLNIIVYGDGDGTNYKPLTSLDVCAHELGHGVNAFTAQLGAPPYYHQEEDALNEGLSDIWASSVESWAARSKDIWLMESEIMLGSYTCERNSENPSDATTLEGRHPDTYQGSYWDFSGEPHFNSTVLSHWFYLLVTGGSGWNNGYTSHASSGMGYHWTVNGIGMSDARRIVYKALTTLYGHG